MTKQQARSEAAAIRASLESLIREAESAEEWSHICALETRYVELTGRQYPGFCSAPMTGWY